MMPAMMMTPYGGGAPTTVSPAAMHTPAGYIMPYPAGYPQQAEAFYAPIMPQVASVAANQEGPATQPQHAAKKAS